MKARFHPTNRPKQPSFLTFSSYLDSQLAASSSQVFGRYVRIVEKSFRVTTAPLTDESGRRISHVILSRVFCAWRGWKWATFYYSYVWYVALWEDLCAIQHLRCTPLLVTDVFTNYSSVYCTVQHAWNAMKLLVVPYNMLHS